MSTRAVSITYTQSAMLHCFITVIRKGVGLTLIARPSDSTTRVHPRLHHAGAPETPLSFFRSGEAGGFLGINLAPTVLVLFLACRSFYASVVLYISACVRRPNQPVPKSGILKLLVRDKFRRESQDPLPTLSSSRLQETELAASWTVRSLLKIPPPKTAVLECADRAGILLQLVGHSVCQDWFVPVCDMVGTLLFWSSVVLGSTIHGLSRALPKPSQRCPKPLLQEFSPADLCRPCSCR